MLVDPLTKGLSPNVFQEHVVGMGLLESLSSWTGHIKQPTPIMNNVILLSYRSGFVHHRYLMNFIENGLMLA
jgi:hypothetical protein